MGSDESARRDYWASKMDEAASFMGAIMRAPVHECGERMTSLADAAAAAGVEVAFSQKPHGALGLTRLFYLRDGLIAQFVAAAAEMNRRGWVLKVEDAYRTPQMQQGLGRQEGLFRAILNKTRWELGGEEPSDELMLRRLGALIAIAPKVGTHVSGSAIDISVLDKSGDEVDRGAPCERASTALNCICTPNPWCCAYQTWNCRS